MKNLTKKVFPNAIFVFIFFNSLFQLRAIADCLACWEMRGVKIITFENDTIYGYVTWNDSWYTISQGCSLAKFPKCFIDDHLTRKRFKFNLYKKIFLVNYPYQNAYVVRRSDVITIEIKNIKRISAKRLPHNGLPGAGEVVVVSDSLVSILQKRPFAQYALYESCWDIYFLSYNKNINEDSLIAISNSNFWGKREYLEGIGVIILKYSFD